jgi:glutamate synthase domain-containing protein 2
MSSISINLEKIAKVVNATLPALVLVFGALGVTVSFYFNFITVFLILLTFINVYYLFIQTHSTLLSNFGLIAQFRYLIESIGPELRQYLFANDTEEKPFNRVERSEVYRKAKDIDSSAAFGSQLNWNGTEFKLRHSMYPVKRSDITPFSLTFGEERKIKQTYTLKKPIIISAMSYGALGEKAVRSLARGAKKASILMNTGEGGFPKYHLRENADLIFQIGTAKFGVRDKEGNLNEENLKKIALLPHVKMIEIKLSQGAKPGKGGLLPKEKITEEISQLRGVPLGEDVISPAFHHECTNPEDTLSFIKRVQDVSGLPVGIKLCLGREDEFRTLVKAMKTTSIHPDWITLDGGEGGTGAAPKSFMDDIGVSLFQAIPVVQRILVEEGIRDSLKLLCSGKLINPGKQFIALSLGADACYSARGFMLSIGCVQALQCNNNKCPVGITTHDKHLQAGLDIENKSERVFHYINNLDHDYYELLAAMGKRSFKELNSNNVLFPYAYKELEHLCHLDD